RLTGQLQLLTEPRSGGVFAFCGLRFDFAGWRCVYPAYWCCAPVGPASLRRRARRIIPPDLPSRLTE
ncbi:hypothetical protein, partial [Enterobacter sp.]|uniref:hypothetical protein n=1 Tax=Enterobacter sp. TaxID=42895 RepID=UPI00296E5356